LRTYVAIIAPDGMVGKALLRRARHAQSKGGGQASCRRSVGVSSSSRVREVKFTDWRGTLRPDQQALRRKSAFAHATNWNFRDIELLDGRARGHNRTRPLPLQSGQMWIKPIELLHLGVGATAEITGAGLSQIGSCDCFEASCGMQAGGKLAGECLVMDEFVFARRLLLSRRPIQFHAGIYSS